MTYEPWGVRPSSNPLMTAYLLQRRRKIELWERLELLKAKSYPVPREKRDKIWCQRRRNIERTHLHHQ